MNCTAALCITLLSYSVIDGDTLRVEGPNVRLWGVDAYERNEPLGPAAANALRTITAGQTLKCERMDVDRYDRIVSRCYLPDGTDIACAMVATGYAWDWRRYSGGYYRECE